MPGWVLLMIHVCWKQMCMLSFLSLLGPVFLLICLIKLGHYAIPFAHFYSFFQIRFFVLIFYLFTFRARGREGERQGEKQQCVRATSIHCLSHAPYWGPGLQPRHVPWPGINPAHLLVLSPGLHLLSHTSQGSSSFLSEVCLETHCDFGHAHFSLYFQVVSFVVSLCIVYCGSALHFREVMPLFVIFTL